MSVLIAAGPHAGTRVGFFPVEEGNEGRLRVTYEKVGQIITGPDGRTPQFVEFSEPTGYETVISSNAELRGFSAGDVERSSVSLSGSARTFEKEVMERGQWYPAFYLRGAPEKDGIFSVEIHNGDTYTIDLNTGEFTVNSVYLFHPDIDARVERECAHIPLDQPCVIVRRGVDFPNVVNGTVPVPVVAPAPRPGRSPSPG